MAVLALPIALGQGWLWVKGLSLLFDAWVPSAILTGLAVVHITSVAIALGALYAAIPLVIAYVNHAQPDRLEAS